MFNLYDVTFLIIELLFTSLVFVLHVEGREHWRRAVLLNWTVVSSSLFFYIEKQKLKVIYYTARVLQAATDRGWYLFTSSCNALTERDVT